MKQNPLLTLESFGQSIWMDFIRRGSLTSGELRNWINEDGASGVTSNPSIFEKAIGGSHDYDEAIRALALEGKSVPDIYQVLTVDDIQHAADLFRPVYDHLQGADGFVSLEVSPHLAHDTGSTIDEARRLWAAVNRPNVLIKVPATPEGIPAIRQLISEGINVNVTLLFGLPRYQQVIEAYMAGLEMRVAQGKPVDRIASVASFFLSRIDVLVDPMLEDRMKPGGPAAETARALRGKVAIASAKMAYQIYQEVFNSSRFLKLAKAAPAGARTQRLLWASTSTKNPAYSDVKYIEALIGPDTVNTVPVETFNAYREHGNPASRMTEDVAGARRVLEQLPVVGIDLDAITQQLEDEGVEKFNQAFDQLLAALEQKRAAALNEPVDRQILNLDEGDASVRERIASLQQVQFGARMWHKDPGLWKQDSQDQESIRNGLGWLHVAEKMEESLGDLTHFADAVKAAGYRHVVHMGMGGSSLAPQVLRSTLTSSKDGLPLTVLDTTDPATILRLEREIPIPHTLFIVASKSGTTAEPLAFAEYFYDKVKAVKGNRTGENFVAITDPGTPLVELAEARGFQRTFLNFADIGGRYSALSYFGLVPAALMGANVSELLARALRMVHACASCVPAGENPGLVLGAAIGELARQGHNKVTFVMPKSISTLGMWLEQLLAESTGKEGTGVLPVASEPVGAPTVYGEDRLFVYMHTPDEHAGLARSATALRDAGQPIATIQMDDPLDVGQEFFRWEIATATAGAILGINPFDQPNVQESKDNTDRLLQEVRANGVLHEPEPTLREQHVSFYSSLHARSATEQLSGFLAQAHPGDYIALQAYVTETPATYEALQSLRVMLRDKLHLATTLGFGPRFLHSTGQFHKGGPNTGLFLQLTADDVQDAPIPGQPYTFGTFKRAQAQGDLEALRKHHRRVMRIHLGSNVGQGLAQLEHSVNAAFSSVRNQVG